ncbi:MAG: hypothetical protein H7296_02580 [Bacteroidia bacterium]|nr:hypothetical protein [Bacteroidia bacterium]
MCDSSFTKIKKLKDGSYELVLEMFDGPDYDKLVAIRIKNGKLLGKQILPYFNSPPENMDNDSYLEYSGVLHSVETPCGNCDSCYYNPTLYYEITDSGIRLDSLTTVRKNKENWGNFYGYYRSENIALPCKR